MMMAAKIPTMMASDVQRGSGRDRNVFRCTLHAVLYPLLVLQSGHTGLEILRSNPSIYTELQELLIGVSRALSWWLVGVHDVVVGQVLAFVSSTG